MRMQKKLYDEGKETTYLNEERIQALAGIEFSWGKRKGNILWEEKFQELLQYKEKFGHCQIPIKWNENKILGRWVSTQRKDYKNWKEGNRSLMTDERRRRLEDVGFSWVGNDFSTKDAACCSIGSGKPPQMGTATTAAEVTEPVLNVSLGRNADSPGCIDHSGEAGSSGCIDHSEMEETTVPLLNISLGGVANSPDCIDGSGEASSSACINQSEMEEATLPVLNVSLGGHANSPDCVDHSGEDGLEGSTDHSEMDDSEGRSLSRSSSTSTLVV